MTSANDPPRGPSRKERVLFEQVMGETRKLDEKQREPAVVQPKPAPRATAKSAPERAPEKPPQAAPAPSPPPAYSVERRAMVPGLDRRTSQRLARGQLVIDASLDLHGLRQEAAHRALESFVLSSHRAGRRCVLIVTGKGGPKADAKSAAGASIMSDDAPGVLKRNLPRWLGQAPLTDKVLAIRPAVARHGGAGAFYVLLRRHCG